MRVPGIPYVQGRNDYDDSDGKKYAIAIHNTSNDASAADEASYAQRRSDGISAHFYVDARVVVQSLDTTDRAGHAGSRNGNENAIAVEITGVNNWTRQQWLDRVAWTALGHALAAVCRHHGIPVRRCSVAEMKANPKVRGFYSHDDMRRAWGGTTHTDPGPNFPWDRLTQAINAALIGLIEATDSTEDDMTPNERWVLHVINYRVEALKSNRAVINVPAHPDLGPDYKAFSEPNRLAAAVGADDTDEQALAANLAKLLPAGTPVTDEQLVRALRQVFASLGADLTS